MVLPNQGLRGGEQELGRAFLKGRDTRQGQRLGPLQAQQSGLRL
jgi:hypothetical protein